MSAKNDIRGARPPASCVGGALSLHIAAAPLLFASVAAAAVPVEGDRNLLVTVRDAQVTNSSLFPRGEMNVSVENRIRGVHVTSTIVWELDRTYWSYTLVEPYPGGKPGDGKPATRTERAQYIDDGTNRLFFWPTLKYAQVIPDNSASCRDELKVRVSDIWFKLEGSSQWSTLLDPERPTQPGRKFVVRSDTPERVVIENWNPAGGMLKILASLTQGGNVIEYETGEVGKNSPTSSEPGIWRRGKFDWVQTTGGRWRLGRYEYQNSSVGDPGKLDFDFVLTVDSFNPDPLIPQDRFELSSFRLPKGTTVEVTGSNATTYRVGEEDRRVFLDVLDSLSESLRGYRFASPKRIKP